MCRMLLGNVNSSRKLHTNLLERILRLPMSFFDSQPSGRLLNRFSRDTESLDTNLIQVEVMLMHCVLQQLVRCCSCGAEHAVSTFSPRFYSCVGCGRLIIAALRCVGSLLYCIIYTGAE